VMFIRSNQENVYKKNGSVKFQAGSYVSGHHIIELNHGGPNIWWNLHPSHMDRHTDIHRTGTASHHIFKKVIKKE